MCVCVSTTSNENAIQNQVSMIYFVPKMFHTMQITFSMPENVAK